MTIVVLGRFTVEFGVVREASGIKAFGAGEAVKPCRSCRVPFSTQICAFQVQDAAHSSVPACSAPRICTSVFESVQRSGMLASSAELDPTARATKLSERRSSCECV